MTKYNTISKANLSLICLLVASIICAFKIQRPLKLFLLGDSISLHYEPDLMKDLRENFVIEHKAGMAEAFKNLDIPEGANGGDSRMVLNYLRVKSREPEFKPDILLLNCGLHDIKRDKKNNDKIAVDTSQYRQNLHEICRLMEERKIPCIWLRTTNVVDSIHARKSPGFNRYHRDVERYNQIADEVMKNHHVPMIDLYTFTNSLGGNRFVDHVHFTAETQALQAAYIAGFIQYWVNVH